MKKHSLTLLTFAMTAVFANPVAAHDPAESDRMVARPAALAIASTCTELADPVHYNTDAKIPEVKKLKNKCDAEAAEMRDLKASGESASELKSKSEEEK